MKKEMDHYWELQTKFMNKENEAVVREFLLQLKLSNRSELTIILYRKFLEQFFDHWNESYSSLSSDVIHQWFLEHHGHVKESTFKNRLSIVSSFYTFCVQEGYLGQSPIKRRWFPRLAKSLPKYLEKEEVAKIRGQSEKSSLRDQVLVEFMLTSGCRLGEVQRLNKKDVDLDNRTATVMGKGRKIRQVHFTAKCAVLLERYLDTLKENNSPALFNSFSSGQRLVPTGIGRVIKKIGMEAGMNKNLHPHRFRHTFATDLLAKGADLSFIGEELGHNDVSTTQIYARLPKREIVAQYRKYMG